MERSGMQDFHLRLARRPDLDWIRVGAFLLLILYHVGMAFVTWDWHVKTAHPGPGPEGFMALLNPWRLSLLFFVSGCATSFMGARLSPSALARLRLGRLGIPLLFGMLVIVPPQSWVQVREHGFRIGYWAFYGRYLTFDEDFCDARGCLILPTWNHLWFVAYLLAYTLGLAAVLAWAPRVTDWLGRRAARVLSGPGALLAPCAWLVAARWFLAPRFEETHALLGDWYAHSVYLAVFLLGVGLARQAGFWREADRLRWMALGLALVCGAAWALYVHAYTGDAVPTPALRRAMRCVYGIDQWSTIMAVLGWGQRHLRRGGPALDYLTQGVFPFYILHQTIIVLTEFWLKRVGLPQPAEAGILVVVTAAGCLAGYEAVRRVRWLRPLFGLRPAQPA
jgi:hypothetical protein